MVIGSKEWFRKKSESSVINDFVNYMEELREAFFIAFSPNKLRLMSGDELLLKVFDNTDNTMMHLLMMDSDYRQFGASSEYSYMSIIYKGADGVWTRFENNKHTKLSQIEAEKQAETIRDEIIRCTELIEEKELVTISDYNNLEKNMQKVSNIYNYVTILKYFQMIYPFYFPGMYSDFTLNRCIQILGLNQSGKSSTHRIRNMGVISIFYRACDINNIAFNKVYSNEWGWEKSYSTCPASTENNRVTNIAPIGVNKIYYRLDNSDQDTIQIAKEIEEEISSVKIKGIEKESLVRVRVNQGIFRDRLLLRFSKCCLCGVTCKDYLIASHIKPWSECKDEERLDIDNGFLLCPNHDKLFDKGFISFDDDGAIKILQRLSDIDAMYMNVNSSMRMQLTPKNKEYLSYHRENVFK